MNKHTGSGDQPRLTDSGIDVGDDYEYLVGELEDAHGDPIVETDSQILFRDEARRELNEFAEDMNVKRRHLGERMNRIARGLTDDEWTHSDPVVLSKP